MASSAIRVRRAIRFSARLGSRTDHAALAADQCQSTNTEFGELPRDAFELVPLRKAVPDGDLRTLQPLAGGGGFEQPVAILFKQSGFAFHPRAIKSNHCRIFREPVNTRKIMHEIIRQGPWPP